MPQGSCNVAPSFRPTTCAIAPYSSINMTTIFLSRREEVDVHNYPNAQCLCEYKHDHRNTLRHPLSVDVTLLPESIVHFYSSLYSFVGFERDCSMFEYNFCRDKNATTAPQKATQSISTITSKSSGTHNFIGVKNMFIDVRELFRVEGSSN